MIGRMVHHVRRPGGMHYGVRLYVYVPGDDAVVLAAHILQHFIDKYLVHKLKRR